MRRAHGKRRSAANAMTSGAADAGAVRAPGLKAVLERISPEDSAGVQKQLVEQLVRVKLRLSRVRRKILVLSGKGGVGKSAVASQLSLALARSGERVGVLDADLNGPCIPRMLGVAGARFSLDAVAGGADAPAAAPVAAGEAPGPSCRGVRPVEGPLGIRVASLSFLADPRGPVRWRGPMDLTPVWLGLMEAGVIRELLSDVEWGELDTLLFDLPPGAAADKPPVLASLLPDLGGAVVVTTPSPVAIDVVRRSILYARDLGIRVLGLVENLGPAACPRCGAAAEASDGPQALAAETGVPLLGRIPRDPDLARSLETGIPLPEAHPMSRAFGDLAGRIGEMVS